MPTIVKRKSDGSVLVFEDGGPQTKVGELKKIVAQLPPKHPRGTRLIFGGKVMKSIWKLEHYKINNHDTIIMDDTKNWQVFMISKLLPNKNVLIGFKF